MSAIPAFEPGVWNAWWFMIIYPLQWLVVILIPSRIGDRTSHAKEIVNTRKDMVMSILTQGLWVGATLYSIFIPFQTGTPWFWIGLALFITGLSILIAASLAVYSTPADTPFTSGVYRFSRHPMYLSMILVYLAVSVATASWLFLLITIITFFLQTYQAKKEEGYCIEKFGDDYLKYMRRTARWIGIPKPVVP
jgi:protein-S-isoprenylcysteine O-methyltransferase Ste14